MEIDGLASIYQIMIAQKLLGVDWYTSELNVAIDKIKIKGMWV